MTLPTADSFLVDAGLKEAKAEEPLALNQPTPFGASVSAEFRKLLVDYCASHISATQLSEVDWTGLGYRLGTQKEFLQQVAQVLDQNGMLWQEVLAERIRRASSARVFRDVSWERVESKAVGKLAQLLEKDAIRDPGELLAVAAAARKVNVGSDGGGGTGQGVTVNINGVDSMAGENGLPGAGAKMTIDLSPKVATSLGQRMAQKQMGERVIDGEMLTAKELRETAAARAQQNATGIEGDSE